MMLDLLIEKGEMVMKMMMMMLIVMMMVMRPRER